MPLFKNKEYSDIANLNHIKCTHLSTAIWILSLTKQKLKNNIGITGDDMVRIMGRNFGKFWKEQ